MTAKKRADAPPGLRPRARAPIPPCYATACKQAIWVR